MCVCVCEYVHATMHSITNSVVRHKDDEYITAYTHTAHVGDVDGGTALLVDHRINVHSEGRRHVEHIYSYLE